MPSAATIDGVTAALARITAARREGRAEELAPYLESAGSSVAAG